MQGKTLLVIVGPTGVGKTHISIRLARQWAAPIISADSRQFYRELRIGTAAPTEDELRAARHYFIGTHSIHDEYNSGQFELDVHRLLDELFASPDLVLLVGGSMLDVDAVIMALGTSPNPLITSTTEGLETYRWGGIVAEEATGKTSRLGVFAGGDAVTGAATVILAMGAGKTAAKAIDFYIQKTKA